MKKILLLGVWQCVFLTYAFSSEVTCLSRTYYVNDLISLNEKITFLVNDAATYSTTIMLLNGTYASNTAQALFRDINPQGPCPCTILAETDYGVTLQGRILWRSYSAKNLTIRGINFIKTRFAGASPIVEFSIASSNNKIMNCTFAESVFSIPSGTNYYIQMHGGQNNTIENCEFKTKKSLGHYINMAETRNNKITNSTFFEVNDDDDIKYYLLLRDNRKAIIKGCTFRDKFSEGHYIGLNFDSATLFDSNSFSETSFMHPDAGVDFTVDSAKYYIDIHIADKCKVAGNTFHNKLSIGHAIDVSDYDSNPGKNRHVIVDNNFNSMYLRAPQSFIKVGHCGDNTTTAELNAGIIIQGNLFRRYNYNNYGYNEIISNKSSGNSYLFNTFEECNGTLFLRCGNSITVEGNRFLGTHQPQEGGLGICGANHKIYNNHFEELGNFALMLIAGNAIPSNQDNCYPTVENSFLSFNTIVNCHGNIYFNKYMNNQNVSINFIMPANNKFDNNIVSSNIATNPLVRIDSDFIPFSDVANWNTNKFNKNVFNTFNLGTLVSPGWTINTHSSNYIEIDPDLIRSWETYIPRTTNSVVIGNAYTVGYGFVTADIFLQTRDSSPDIGCYERVSGSLSRIENEALFYVYPNPVSSIITVGVQDKTETKISIYDIYEKKWHQEIYNKKREVEIDITSYPAGHYILKVESDGFAKFFRIIKEK